MTTGELPRWASASLDGTVPPPVVLLLGGFLTSPPLYRPFVRRLRARGVADVVVGNVWLMDWLLAMRGGIGPILTRSGRGLLEACRRSERRSLGAPVLVVGHSAGGMTARLLTSPEPFAGRRLNAAGRMGAIVTLGTPHHIRAGGDIGARVRAEGVTFADRVVPGAAFAPRVGYLAVASRHVVGRADGSFGERRAWRIYQDLHADRGEVAMEGDGLIPRRSATLRGAPSVVLDGAVHGQWPGDWYGSERFIDAWWPRALGTWREALVARARGTLEAPGMPAPTPSEPLHADAERTRRGIVRA